MKIIPLEEEIEIKISEMFGPTLQGEGRSQGRPAAFIRFSLCNLDCSWCDTPYTWDWRGKNGIAFDPDEEIHRIPLSDVLEWARPFIRIIISGGEPFVQKRALIALTDALLDMGKIVEIETNGTHDPTGLNPVILCSVSPKIGSSGVAWNRAIRREALLAHNFRGSHYKFVVSDQEEIPLIRQIVSDIGIAQNRVWLMPEGRTKEEILARLPFLFEICSIEGWNLSPRLHVLAFDDKRGI